MQRYLAIVAVGALVTSSVTGQEQLAGQAINLVFQVQNLVFKVENLGFKVENIGGQVQVLQ